MKDKVQKIREEVARIQLYSQSEVLKQVIDYIDKMQEEPVSEDLEKIVEEIAEPTILNAYGTKELARRLRNTICGTSVSEDLEEASKEWLSPQLDKSYAAYGETKQMELTHFDGYAMLDAIEFGAQWQFNQLEKNRLADCDRQTEEEAEREQDFVMGIIENEHRQPTFDDAIKYGMRLKEKEMQSTIELAEEHAYFAGRTKTIDEIKESLLSEVLPCFMHGGESDEVVAKLDEVLNQNK
jgi:hypothetical protein